MATISSAGILKADVSFWGTMMHLVSLTLTVLFAALVGNFAYASQLGDVNLDSSVNLLDVDPFIAVLGSGEYQYEADANLDGVVNLLDVDGFIGLVAGDPPPKMQTVVLRDTIGPDSSETDGAPGSISRTNQGSSWSSPGMRFSNTTNHVATMGNVRIAIFVFEDAMATNDINLLEQKTIQFHLWRDGVEGNGDSYESNPEGAEVNGHTVIDLHLNQNIFAMPLGLSGPQNDHQTFVLYSDLSSLCVTIPPGNEVVFSFLVKDDGGSPIDFGTLLSRLDFGVEDVYTSENTFPQDYPGYLMSQLGLPVPNYGAFVSVEVPIK